MGCIHKNSKRYIFWLVQIKQRLGFFFPTCKMYHLTVSVVLQFLVPRDPLKTEPASVKTSEQMGRIRWVTQYTLLASKGKGDYYYLSHVFFISKSLKVILFLCVCLYWKSDVQKCFFVFMTLIVGHPCMHKEGRVDSFLFENTVSDFSFFSISQIRGFAPKMLHFFFELELYMKTGCSYRSEEIVSGV